MCSHNPSGNFVRSDHCSSSSVGAWSNASVSRSLLLVFALFVFAAYFASFGCRNTIVQIDEFTKWSLVCYESATRLLLIVCLFGPLLFVLFHCSWFEPLPGIYLHVRFYCRYLVFSFCRFVQNKELGLQFCIVQSHCSTVCSMVCACLVGRRSGGRRPLSPARTDLPWLVMAANERSRPPCKSANPMPVTWSRCSRLRRSPNPPGSAGGCSWACLG